MAMPKGKRIHYCHILLNKVTRQSLPNGTTPESSRPHSTF